MEASTMLGILLPVVFIVVGIALVWLLIELVKTVKVTRKTVEDLQAQLTPTLDNVQKMTTDLQPAITKVDPLVDRLQLTVDAANLELMRLDSILEDVNGVTDTLANTSAAIDNVANAPLSMVTSVTERLRAGFRGRRSSTSSAALAEAAAQVQKQEAQIAPKEEPVAKAVKKDVPAASDAEAGASQEEPENQYYTYESKSGAEAASEAEAKSEE